MIAPTSKAATDRALKLFVVLSRAHAAVARHADEDITGHELTTSEFAVLELLFHKGPTLLGDIQRRILVSSGGITWLVDRLAQRGLVERRTCDEDKRARYAALTREGMKLMKGIFPPHAERIVEAMSGLTAAEQEVAIRLLKKLGLAAAGQALTHPNERGEVT